MTQPPPTTTDATKAATQIAIIVVAFALLLNVSFYFLSGLYYDDKRASQGLMTLITDKTVRDTRISFAVFTGVVTLSTVGTLFQPRWVSIGIAGAASLASLIAGVFAIRGGMPGALSVALLAIGMLIPVLVWGTIVRARAAWAFLTALAYVLAVVLLFGAPKIRAQINIGLWTAMVIPGLLAIAALGLTMIREDYRER